MSEDRIRWIVVLNDVSFKFNSVYDAASFTKSCMIHTDNINSIKVLKLYPVCNKEVEDENVHQD